MQEANLRTGIVVCYLNLSVLHLSSCIFKDPSLLSYAYTLCLRYSTIFFARRSCIRMKCFNLKSLQSFFKAPSNELNKSVEINFGVYQGSDRQLWIDGSWLKDYGDYKADQRNFRVEAAKTAFPTAKLHASPHSVHSWELVG